MHGIAPRSITLDADDVHRINRANAAILLHIEPERVDKMPLADVMDVLQVHDTNERLRNEPR